MSIDSMFVHKMWNDNELEDMVKVEYPIPCFQTEAGR
jgi:alkyl hydroperoxide reductase subunit AhpC